MKKTSRVISFLSTIMLCFCFTGLLFKDNSLNASEQYVYEVIPTIETEQSSMPGDNADDIAIWIHPSEIEKSLIIGTNKKSGIALYDLDGRLLQFREDGELNNVDVRYGFTIDGQKFDIITATNRTDNSIAIYTIDASTLTLRDISARKIYSNLEEVYGLCMYHDRKEDNFYCFVNSKDGSVEEWQLFSNDQLVDATLVRQFKFNSQTEGCVVDDEKGYIFVGEENVGIWRLNINEGNEIKPLLIDRTAQTGHLTADVEGLALYTAANGNGYLIASSQGNSTYVVYNRREPHEYIGTFKIVDNQVVGIDGVTETDGIDVINIGLNEDFPNGVFIAQDDINTNPDGTVGNQNFKLVPWEIIAKPMGLIIDNKYNPLR